MAEETKRYTRREFIDRTTKGAVGLIGYSALESALSKASAKSNDNSTVIIVKHDEAGLTGYEVDQDVAQVMVDAGIPRLTGIDDIGEAWKSLFPGITQSSVISIKVNCFNSHFSSHPEVAFSIANSLTNMQVEGNPFPEENIIIWDNSNSKLQNGGYTINTGDTGVKCFGTGNDYSETEYDVAGKPQRLSKILTDMSDYMINLCLLKNHYTAGVTLSLKNHYGSCINPADIHDGHCDPYIPALNALSPIRDKHIISICDAVWGMTSGGPSGETPQINPNSLIFSKDPVANDYIALKILEDNGCSTIYKATHIATAAQTPYNLGTNDPAQIDVINIDNPTVGIDKKKSERVYSSDFRLYQNYPNPFNPQTTISYQLFKPANVKLNIYNIQGVLIRNLVDKQQSIGYYRILWDGRTANGIPAPSGAYLGRLQIDNVHSSIRMALIK